MSHLNAPPSFQKISMNGIALEEDEKTVNDYSIVPNSILTLEILEQETYSSKDELLEAGFSGTSLLLTHANDFAVSSPSSGSSNVTWACSQCTFVNTNRDTCEMCGFECITILD